MKLRYGRFPMLAFYNPCDVESNVMLPNKDKKIPLSSIIVWWRITDYFAWLLYKIDTVLLRSNCRHCLEVTVEVALVKKPTLKSSFRNIPALS